MNRFILILKNLMIINSFIINVVLYTLIVKTIFFKYFFNIFVLGFAKLFDLFHFFKIKLQILKISFIFNEFYISIFRISTTSYVKFFIVRHLKIYLGRVHAPSIFFFFWLTINPIIFFFFKSLLIFPLVFWNLRAILNFIF